jgi:hypothetical protein
MIDIRLAMSAKGKIKDGIKEMQIKFVAKLGAMGKYDKDQEEKFHVMVPRQHISKIKHMKGKQVKVTIEDEI